MFRIPMRLFAVAVSSVFVLAATIADAQPPARANGAMVLVRDVVKKCHHAACDVAVVPSPLPGRSRVVSKRDVLAAIDQAGYEPGDLRIPERRRVMRPAQRVDEKGIRARIEKSVEDILPSGVRLESLGRMARIEVPKKGYEVRASWPGAKGFRRRVSVPVDILSDGVKFRTIQVAATLVYETKMPVAVRDLGRGSVVESQDVEWRMVRLETAPTHLVPEKRLIVGRKLDVPVAAGEPFRERDLSRLPVVFRGQRLTVASEQGLIRVKTSGEAKQDGAVGDRIRVLLMSAGRMVWAEVQGPGLAMVLP